MKRFNTYLIEKLKVSAKTLDIDAFKDEFNEFLNADTTWYFDILSDDHKIYTVKKDVNVSKILNSIYNTTGAKYIIQLKINYACDLLLYEKFSITQVAEICGYDNVYYFSRQFKAYIGTSPSVFVEKYISSK